ncbi:MAG: HAD-IC family P-type ATPase, partial [Syntrophomonadaceae bacterium]|nr:HAD-IC family P-type ATPase [Syntrophomonadaceae bacterium]
MTAEQVLQQLGSRPGGLSASEAAARLAQAGPNQLQEGRRRTLVGMFLDQFKDFMILVLVVAGVISGLVGEAADAVAIVVIVALNAVIGFVQEYRAEKAMAALRLMAAPLSTVRRDGEQTLVPSVELVPGDVVVLEAGNIIPADLRLIEAAQLRVDESALTGESQPVDKQVAPVHDAHALLGDRYNMAYKGTVVTYGRGAGVVVATGMGTELGRIASLLQDEVLKTPLQQRLARFGQSLALAVLAICAVVFAVGLLRGESPLLMFLTAVSLAVAAIPEALPAVVTVSLALGARKMVEANALVRRLPAVETLGSVTFICTDKTGTLTLNRMRVEQVYADGSWWTLGEAATREVSAPARRLFMAMALSTDVVKGSDDEIFGDPTEVALYQAALQAGFSKESLLADYPRVAELPFDSARKCMTTIHRHPAGGFISFSKGALESLLPASAGVLTSGGLHHPHVADLKAVGDHMALSGLRVLAFACRELDALPPTLSPSEVEQDLVLLGLAGLLDPPRQEAREAVEVCRQAGIRPVMITGDHPLTARTIAARLGILDEGEVITGQDLDELGEGELKRRVRDIRVYARVAPEQKLAIVRALQDNGEFVAMTGDGVNDAPALRRADIGIAMGVTGTDVAKEASDLILLDDNFASIVRAIREGRKIYDNIRKFIRYTM